MYDEWLLDISLGTDPPCFVPYLRETNEIIFGMNIITPRSPGRLVGVIHLDGQEEVEAWCAKNPDWVDRFSSLDKENHSA